MNKTIVLTENSMTFPPGRGIKWASSCRECSIAPEILFGQQLVTSFQVKALLHKHHPEVQICVLVENILHYLLISQFSNPQVDQCLLWVRDKAQRHIWISAKLTECATLSFKQLTLNFEPSITTSERFLATSEWENQPGTKKSLTHNVWRAGAQMYGVQMRKEAAVKQWTINKSQFLKFHKC